MRAILSALHVSFIISAMQTYAYTRCWLQTRPGRVLVVWKCVHGVGSSSSQWRASRVVHGCGLRRRDYKAIGNPGTPGNPVSLKFPAGIPGNVEDFRPLPRLSDSNDVFCNVGRYTMKHCNIHY